MPHGTGIDIHHVTDRAVAENGRRDRNQSEPSEIAVRRRQQEKKGKQNHTDNDPDRSLDGGADIVFHGYPPFFFNNYNTSGLQIGGPRLAAYRFCVTLIKVMHETVGGRGGVIDSPA
jgi:hypothetical protein